MFCVSGDKLPVLDADHVHNSIIVVGQLTCAAILNSITADDGSISSLDRETMRLFTRNHFLLAAMERRAQ
jgi:hypothetical protein